MHPKTPIECRLRWPMQPDACLMHARRDYRPGRRCPCRQRIKNHRPWNCPLGRGPRDTGWLSTRAPHPHKPNAFGASLLQCVYWWQWGMQLRRATCSKHSTGSWKRTTVATRHEWASLCRTCAHTVPTRALSCSSRCRTMTNRLKHYVHQPPGQASVTVSLLSAQTRRRLTTSHHCCARSVKHRGKLFRRSNQHYSVWPPCS